mgnify:FL=1
MSRIIISNDGECILLRQGSTVIVIGQDQADSIAATIANEARRMRRSPADHVREFDSAVRAFHAVYVEPR